MDPSSLTARPASSPPDEYYVRLLVFMSGAYIPAQPLSEYVNTPMFGALRAATNGSAAVIGPVFEHAFGPNATLQEAATMIREKLPHTDNLPLVRGISILFLIISSLLVMTRLIGRWKVLQRRLTIGDWMLTVAWAFALVSSTFFIATPGFTHYYRRMWDISWMDFLYICKWIVIGSPLSLIGHTLIQLSILNVYYSFLPSRNLQRAAYLIGFIIILSTIAFFPPLWVKCGPFVKNINDTSAYLTCQKMLVDISIASTVFYIVSDLAIIAIPIPVLWKLRLPKLTKIGVILLFTIGGFALVFSIIKATLSIDITPQINPDVTVHSVTVCLCQVLETHFGMACACLPAIRAIYRTWRERNGGRSIVDVFRPGATRTGGDSGAQTSTSEPITKVNSEKESLGGEIYPVPSQENSTERSF